MIGSWAGLGAFLARARRFPLTNAEMKYRNWENPSGNNHNVVP
jgi:hypothetical protein